jgi:gluconokinase
MNQITNLSNLGAETNLIIVMGVSGSGKSTVAQAIAEHYGYCFLDADDFHSDENKNHMANGLPLTDEMRAPWVDSIKTYLHAANKQQKHCVLAFSGLRKQHRNKIREAGLKTIFIFLNGDKEVIQRRVNSRKDHFMAPVLVSSQFATLEDPSDEHDVKSIDVSMSLKCVIANAIQTIDNQYELGLSLSDMA